MNYSQVKWVGSLLMAIPLVFQQLSVVDHLIIRAATWLFTPPTVVAPIQDSELRYLKWEVFYFPDQVDIDLWVGLQRVMPKEREKRTGGS
jgi:hypothetical protein